MSTRAEARGEVGAAVVGGARGQLMCGIAGILEAPGSVVDEAEVRAMIATLAHRGPDASGVFNHANVGLGHRRLSIIDTSRAADQPMIDDELGVVFNGEIYNFRELRAELETFGHRFRTRSDTEVLLAAYKQWGRAMIDRLRGMFAFAIHDAAGRSLLLARDRLGKKPLYYSLAGGRLVFASEIKAIRRVNAGDRELDAVAIGQFATFGYSLGERTAFAATRELPPGHTLIAETDRPPAARVERYWQVDFTPERGVSESEWLERLDAVLDDAVRLRLISDVPLGAFLSGGIDSSLITAYMTRHSDEVRTFAIGFRDSRFDESIFASEIANTLGTDHLVEYVEPDAAAILPELVATYDEPFADSSAIPTWYLCRMARRHVTVALSGDGGDELHGGYNRYTKGAILETANRFMTEPGRRIARRLVAALPVGLRRRGQLAQIPLRGLARYQFTHGLIEEHLDLLRPELVAAIGDSLSAELERDFGRYEGTVAFQNADVANYLPEDILVKVDRASMRHALEVRCPLLDQEFVELSARIPIELKLAGTTGKRLLRALLARHVPPELFERPKRGFAVPMAAWLRRELAGEVSEMLADESSSMWTMFDLDTARRYARRHRRRAFDLSSALWRLVFFYAWSRENQIEAL